MNKVLDLFVTYQFLKRLVTPFEKWKAFELGIIDKEGNVLKKKRDFTTQDEKDAWGYFDTLTANMKKLLAKVPGGSSRFASIGAAMLMLREHTNREYNWLDEKAVMKDLNEQIKHLNEEVPANAVGTGANVSLPPAVEPGVKKKRLKGFVSYTRRKELE